MLSAAARDSQSPSIATLHKYAEACGMRLRIHIDPLLV